MTAARALLLLALIAAVCAALSGCGGGDPADCRANDISTPAELRLSEKGSTYTASMLDYKVLEVGSGVTLSGSFDLSVEGYGDAEVTVRARLYDSLSTTQFDAVVAVVKTVAGSSHKSRIVVPDFSWSPSTAPRTAVLYVYWQSTGTDAGVTLRNRFISVNECLK